MENTCPICRNHKQKHLRKHRSLKNLWHHMSQEHTQEELVDWGEKELGLTEREVLACRVNWKFQVAEWLWKRWRTTKVSVGEVTQK